MAPRTTPEPTPAAAQDTNAFEITRHFAVPAEMLFDAWVGPEWAQWLPYPQAVIEINQIDTRTGGRYDLTARLPGGPTLTLSGTYLEVSRPTKLVFTWHSSLSPHDSLVSVTLRPSGEGTLLTLRHEHLPIPDLLTNHRSGWLSALDRLRTRMPPTQRHP